MELNKVKRLAADVMKTGKKRVKIVNPEEAREVMTREDVREKIEEGVIRKKQKKGTSKGRARKIKSQKKKGRKKGRGKRKGAKGSHSKPKEEWMKKVRALRKLLREKKPDLKPGEYRKLYKKIKGNYFRGKKHLENYIEENNLKKSD